MKPSIEDAMMLLAHFQGEQLSKRWKGRSERLAQFLKLGPCVITADALAMALETCLDHGYYPSFTDLLLRLAKRLSKRAKTRKASTVTRRDK